MSDVLEIRSFEVREVKEDDETREFSGIGVPYGEVAQLADYSETFARDAVQDSDDALLFWRHEEPIGRIVRSENTEAGWAVTARISKTPRGDEAYTLLRDGVISKLSVGFNSLEHVEDRKTGLVTRSKVRVREVSLVPNPAYSGAAISQVRSAAEDATPKEITVTESNVTAADLDEVRAEFDRKFATVQVTEAPKVSVDTRSGGEILKAIIHGDEDTNRAYTGGTTADAIMHNNFMGDVTRIVADAAPLRGLFSTDRLPDSGNVLEYGQMTSNTITAGQQVHEGDALPYGKIAFGVFTATVGTYGGYTTLSRQEIERSSVPVLNTALQVQAIELGNEINGLIRANYVTQVAAQTTANNKVTIPGTGVKYTDWLNAAIDASVLFSSKGLSLDGLIVSPTEFKALLNFAGGDGRPLFSVSGQAVNTVGDLNVRTLTGDLASIPVYLDPLLAAGNSAFFNRLAVTVYESPAYRLQADDVIHLTRDFSIYEYAAIANTVPFGIVPVKAAA